ncbi:hypothetical protein GCM10017744_002450 [Streptomyces antimycoticus]|uniref:Uncharacterized protein n=1 Tax=Streptomyces antimycoticus TaxID=68175 RepID=A0A4D4KSM4_9ACTN|nr:hypothetical protein SANT12839_097210 [Streptomyces antimycoticus]
MGADSRGGGVAGFTCVDDEDGVPYASQRQRGGQAGGAPADHDDVPGTAFGALQLIGARQPLRTRRQIRFLVADLRSFFGQLLRHAPDDTLTRFRRLLDQQRSLPTEKRVGTLAMRGRLPRL